MGRRRRKATAVRKLGKLRKKIPISEEYWSGLLFTYPQFIRWGVNFRVIFTSNPDMRIVRKRLEKHGYSFEKLGKEHPKLVGKALKVVEEYEKGASKVSFSAAGIARRDSRAMKGLKERLKRKNIEFKRKFLPDLYKLYKILRERGFSNPELCGFVPKDDLYVIK